MLSIIDLTDSYKIAHWDMLPEGTTEVYSYFESRPGAQWPYTQFFGLQYILKEFFEGKVVSLEDVQSAKTLHADHFGDPNIFNEAGWLHIIEAHGGRLPLHIKAVAEGTIVPIDNVLMTVVNTCPDCAWLTNYVESVLTHIWYSSNVATLSRTTRDCMEYYLRETGSDPAAIDFMLHDFGYRGATGNEAAGIGGLGHLVNFMGTDTIPAMRFAQKYYGHTGAAGYSVPATEHSVMTALGVNRDLEVLDKLLDTYPTGILSVVADSFNIYDFTEGVVDRKERILAREGRFVLRPDSVTKLHDTPEELVVELLDMMWRGFGGIINDMGFKVLDTHVRVLWGDGIGPDGIDRILDTIADASFAAENMVFGMGGGLLQKHNRDTQRSAFKCSSQTRNGEEASVQKTTYGKQSKAGKLNLIRNWFGKPTTIRVEPGDTRTDPSMLQTVFLDGDLYRELTLSEIRQNALSSRAAYDDYNSRELTSR